MNKRIIPISLPVTGNDEWLALKEPLETGWLTAGPKVRAFEKAFAERHSVKHAIAVTSATTALHLALVALDIKQGDRGHCTCVYMGINSKCCFISRSRSCFL